MFKTLSKTKNLVSISKAAEILGVSIDTVRRWDKNGRLHSQRPNGKNRYFSQEELEKIKFSHPLSISQAAQYLGLSQTSLRRAEKKGLIKPQRNSNNERIYTLDILNAFLKPKSVIPQEQISVQEINNIETTVFRLKNFYKNIATAGLFLATSLILIISALTILFLLFPEDTAKVLGYYKQNTATNNQGLVLGAKTSKDKEKDNSFTTRILQAFNNVSLRAVKVISPETYTRIIPYQAINDVNDVIIYDEKKNTVFLNELATWTDLGSVLTVDINGGTIDGVVIGGSSASEGTFTTLNTGQGANELYGMDQNILTTSAVTFTTLDTGQGANELYDMNQNVQTTDAVTFTTLDTGQGGNELYDMDQNVQTTSDVIFNTVSLESGGVKLSGDDDGAITFLGLGDGFDENLTLNLDDTQNTGVFTSSTGLTTINFSGITLQQSGVALFSSSDIDTSSELASILTDETGSGALVFANTPTLITPILGVASATSIAIGANTLDTNEWAYLDSQNQGVKTTSAVTFATVDTGQGANELYDMDQNVLTTSTVTFAGLNATTVDINGGTVDALTSLGIRSTGTGAFDMIIANAENLTVGAKTLTIQLGNADRTLILGTSPSVSGTNTGDQTITLTGDVTGTGTGSFATTISANSVALTDDTTGNYVSSATANGGLTLTGTEGGSLGILLPASADALSATTSSGSGLELLSGGLALLQGCAASEILKWNETSDIWACGTDTGGTAVWDTIDNPTGAGAIAMAELAQTLDWNTAGTAAAFSGLSVTLTNDATTDVNTQYAFVVDNLNDALSTGTTEALIVIDNSDANEAVTDGLLFVSAGGGFTDFIDTPSSVFKVDGSGNITSVTLDTGQGANELYDMDQNVLTTSNVTFADLASTGNTTLGNATGDTVTSNANSWTFANDTNIALTGGINGLSFDTDTLSIDGAGNRVGIGTTTPGTTLSVNGIISGPSTQNLRLQATGATSGDGNNGSIYFLDSGGTTRARLDTSTPVQTSTSTISYTTEGNYTQENMAYSVTLTPSATNGDITLTLGSGNWNTDTRVLAGCRVTGNGGVASLTAAPAAQTTITATTTTNFTDTSAIASGSWYLYCTNFDGSVVKLNTYQGLTYVSNVGTFATTSQGQLPITLYFNTSTVTASIGGTQYLYVIGGHNGGAVISTVYKATIDSSGNVGTFATTSQGQLPATRYYHSTVTATIGGTQYIYVTGGSSTSTVYKATIDTSGNVGTFATTSQGQLPAARDYHSTVTATIGGTQYIYVTGGAPSVSTVYKATIDSSGNVGAFSTTSQGQLPATRYYHSTVTASIGGTQYMYVTGGYGTSTVYKATIGPDTIDPYAPTSTYYTTVTSGDQISTSSWYDVDSAVVTETLNSQTAYYSFSFDGRTTFNVYDGSSGAWRSIARNNSGTWEYNSNATYASTTWTSATTNAQNAAISQAMGTVVNRMTGTIVNAMTDAQWNLSGGYSSGVTTTIDAGVSLYTSSGTQNPQTNSIAFNYTYGYTTLYTGAIDTGNIVPNAGPNTGRTLTTVDSVTGANTGEYTSIYCVTATDCKIAYQDVTNQNLMMADCDDATCSTKTLTTIGPFYNGSFNDLSIYCPTTDDCKIAYSATSTTLTLADCDNATCSTKTLTTVDSLGTSTYGHFNSIYCISSTDCKIVYYYGDTTTDMKMADCDNATCSTKTLTTVEDLSGGYDAHASIYCNSSTDCKIAYYNSGADLMMADCDNSTCSTKTLTTIEALDNANQGLVTSIYCPATDDCKIAYMNQTNLDLMMADCDNATCSTKTLTTVDSTTSGNTGDYPSIYCISTTDCKISYYDTTNTNLMMADCDNATCSTKTLTTVDSVTGANTGEYTSIYCVTATDCKIAYQDVTNQNLMMADCDNAICSTEGGGYNIGSSSLYFNLIYAANFIGKSITTASFDIAENYKVKDESIESGDIVTTDPAEGLVVAKSNTSYQTNMLGIISTKPGITLAEWEDANRSDMRPVALAGRVPVKIASTSASIKIGDFLTSSNEPGKAMKATKAGYTIGKALESWTPCNDSAGNDPTSPEASLGASSCGASTIEVFVNLGYYDPDIYLTDTGELKITKLEATSNVANDASVILEGAQRPIGSDSIASLQNDNEGSLSDVFQISNLSGEIINRVGAYAEAVIANLRAGSISTDTLSVDNKFIIEDEDGKQAITFDNKGNAFFAGTLTADKIKANQIEGLEILTNKISSLNDNVASLSGQIETSTLFDKLVTFLSNVIFRGEVSFESTPTFNKDTAGYAKIETGEKYIYVPFEKEYKLEPVVGISLNVPKLNQTGFEKILLTGYCVLPISISDCQNKLISEVFSKNIKYIITEKSTKGFLIILNDYTPVDLTFSWSAFAINNVNTVDKSTSNNLEILKNYSFSQTDIDALLQNIAVPTATESAVPTPTITPIPSPILSPTEIPIPEPTEITPTPVAP